jgi:hypothetical protein
MVEQLECQAVRGRQAHGLRFRPCNACALAGKSYQEGAREVKQPTGEGRIPHAALAERIGVDD